MECNEIVESDHQCFLIDADVADYFAEELIEGYSRMKRMLNQRRKVRRELFVKNVNKC